MNIFQVFYREKSSEALCDSIFSLKRKCKLKIINNLETGKSMSLS